MHWKLKALVQSSISRLPSAISYNLHYQVQRSLGGLRQSNPISRLRGGAHMMKRIRAHGRSPEGATYLEVGTGHRIAVPLALWLCGAQEIITVDLNPYLAPELIFRDIAYIRSHQPEIRALFPDEQGSAIFDTRFRQLLELKERDGIEQLFSLINLRYLAPADATQLPLPDQSIDVHLSFTVLEHVPPAVIAAILKEAQRVLKPSGLFVHHIDLTDHFSHSDKKITSVNFLQFSEAEWQRYAGNRYMYQNRLRIDELSDLLKQSGLQIQALESSVNQRALQVLREGRISLDPRFAAKAPETNAASSAWITASPLANQFN